MTNYAGGSENNSWSLTAADGTSNVDGGGGTDTLTVNISGYASGASGSWASDLASYSYLYHASTISFANIEALNVTFGNGNDSFTSYGAGVVNLTGGAGNDVFYGGTGNDTLNGGADNDYLDGGRGTNAIDGGSGYDHAAFDFSDRNQSLYFVNQGVAGTTYNAQIAGNVVGTLMNTEVLSVQGSSVSDTIGGVYTVSNSNYVYATLDGNGGNNDTAVVNFGGASYVNSSYSDAANFTLYGYASSGYYTAVNVLDTEVLDFTGSGGADSIDLRGLNGASTLRGGGGDDLLFIGGNSVIDGGSGYDEGGIDFSNRTQAVVLVNGAVAGTTYGATVGGAAAGSMVNIELLSAWGGSGGDRLGGVYKISSNTISYDATLDGNGGTDIAVADFSGASYVNASIYNDSTFTIDGYNASGYSTRLYAEDIEGLDFTGSGGDDTLYLANLTANSILRGGAGNDNFVAGAGDDTLSGGADNDTLNAGAGNDTLQGGAGNDTLDAGIGNNIIDGGADWDQASVDFSDRTGAVALINGGVSGTTYNATVGGVAAGSVTNVEVLSIAGGSGNDQIGGVYTLPGSASYSLTLDGNGGTDTAFVDFSGLVQSSGSSGDATNSYLYGYDTNGYQLTLYLNDIEKLDFTGTSGVDSISLSLLASDSILRGGSGDDSLTTSSGNDTLQGGAGNDTLDAGIGNNIIDGGADWDRASVDFSDRTSAVALINGGVSGTTYNATVGGVAAGSVTNVEALSIAGGSGNDQIGGVYTLPGSGHYDLTLDGNGGTDTAFVDFSGLSQSSGYSEDATNSYLSGYDNGYLLGLNLDDIEKLDFTGTSDVDSINLSLLAGDSILRGGSGDDSLTTGSGNDTLQGGADNDTLNAGTGNNTIDGGTGWDQASVDFSDRTGAVALINGGVAGTTYSATVGGVAAGSVTNVEVLSIAGGSGNDQIGGVYTLPGSGSYSLTLDGNGGTDTAFVDFSGLSQSSGYSSDGTNSNLYGYDTNGQQLALYLNDIEKLDFTGASGADTISLSLLVGDSILRGGSGDDSLTSGSGNDTLQGGADNDTLNAGTGNNTIDGGTGWDQASVDFSDRTGAVALINGGVAGTTYSATVGGVAAGSVTNVEVLSIAGGSGNDQIGGVYTLPGTQTNYSLTLDGNDGTDTAFVDFSGLSQSSGYSWDATNSYLYGYDGNGYQLALYLNDIEKLDFTGASGVDTISLSSLAGDSILRGGSGDDSLTSGSGNDTLQGGADNDILNAGTGNNTIDGGTGYDQASVDFSERTSAVILVNGGVAGTTYNATVGGLAAGSVSNVEVLNVTGGSGNDRIGGTYAAPNGVSSGATLDGNGGTDVAVVDFSALNSISTSVNSGSNFSLYGYDSAYNYSLSVNLLDIEGIDFTGGSTDDNVALAFLTADTVLRGGGGNDTLTSGIGNDTVQGGAGDDTLDGQGGTDTASYSDATSAVTVNLVTGGATGGAGTDILANFENIRGSAFNDTLTGNTGNNVIEGGAGADSMAGGAGNDTYVVDNAGDTITETAGNGVDLVQSSVTWSLGANLENLTLTGTANINGTGNTLNNVIIGNSGGNALNGYTGTDTLIGGAGNDTYVVDDATDIVTENAGEGTDSVQASFTYTLGANLENLTLTGSGNINGTGNALANSIVGNSGNNVIDGGAGVDAMAGGLGNDTYVVDNSGDTVTEAASAGTDLVQSSVGFVLGANIENLTLTGSANVNGGGNTLANTIVGNAGNNVLDGGLGADALAGGLGDDTYVVDDAGDIVTENSGEGSDAVQSAISYTLGANIENLLLTGSANLNGIGNALANTIIGNSGNNVLDGGTGADSLAGGFGDDTYVVDDTADTVTEAAGAGTDTVLASTSYTLAANVENLTLTGASAINGTGNALGNTLLGNGAANTLTGLDGNDVLDGGLGADTLIGGLGDDSYIVDNVGDVVTESVNEGTDTVQATIGWTLGANLENLVLIGTADLSGTGNGVANTITGNDGNNVLDGGAGADSLVGGLGNDTYVVDNAGDVVTETAGAGIDLVQSSIAYTLGSNLENLTLLGSAVSGTGNTLDNIIIGNAAANTLSGLDGNDTLDGGAGADTLAGGTGDDTYVIDNTGDTIVEAAGAGTDTVRVSISYSLSGQQLENLVLTGAANLTATGNGLANGLTGNSGNNTLDGLGGADTLAGGLGNDIYIIDNVSDLVLESAGEGTDTVQSSITYTLSANVENLVLTGTTGISGFGNALANNLTGNAANNTLDGGAGNDTMAGGLGDDRYYVDSTGDMIVEANNAGTDTVLSSVSYNLSGQFLENLTLTGTADINGNGNGLANIVTGNAGNNVLDGGGGNDTMAGGLGNDTYMVDVAGDVVQEANNAGIDTVQSWVSYTLAGSFIENLTLLGQLTNTNATGNSLNNVITGSGGNNVIDGGLGSDTMIGGAGNDTYYVDSTFDIVTEYANQGTDTVISSVGYTLSGSHIENLTLTGSTSTYANGNGLDNVLAGNAGANTMNARGGNDVIDGGLGADTLTGEAGQDIFRFTTALGGGNVDTITDFSVADDTIQLDHAIFAAAGAAGVLTAGAFFAGTAAHDADDRIVYDATTGALFYDADGNGAGAAIQFATIGTGLAVISSDFVLI